MVILKKVGELKILLICTLKLFYLLSSNYATSLLSEKKINGQFFCYRLDGFILVIQAWLFLAFSLNQFISIKTIFLAGYFHGISHRDIYGD